MAWLGFKEKLTWELSSSLPQELINEYEEGIVCNESIETEISYGVTNHTVIVEKRKHTTGPPPVKKAKKHVPSSDTG